MSNNSGISYMPKWKLWVWYTVLFICVGLVIFLPFAVYRKTLLWNSDGYLQWYASLAKVKQIVTEFVKGNGISFWNWDIGLGADLIGNYALNLCDPFCWLAAFFSNKHLDIAYSLIIVLKLYFAGLAMLGFMDYHNKKIFVSLIAAIGYAFCTWGLIAFRHSFFLNQLILFPLLVWGVDRVDNKKPPTLLIISVMMSIVTSLYFTYMSALIIIFYIVLKYFVEEPKKNIKEFIVRFVKFTIYAIIGAGLATPIMLPAFYTLIHASTGTGVDKHLLPTLKELIRFIPSFAGMMNANSGYSVINMNMLAVILLPAIILFPKKEKISRYMLFMCIFCALFPFTQSIFNGFSYSSGRWCYALAFFFVYSMADVLDYGVYKISDFKISGKVWIGIIFCTSLFASVILKAISMKDFFIISINLLFGIVIFYYLSTERELSKKVFFLTLVNIAVIPVVFNSPNLGGDMGIYMSSGETHEIYESTALRATESICDSDFYRVDTVDHPNNSGGTVREAHTPANINIYWKTPSVFEYWSFLDKNWLLFNEVMTNSAGTYRRVCVYSNDNRARLDFLLGVKYFLSDDSAQLGYAGYGFNKINSIDGVAIMQSTYPAGLGYIFESAIAESDFLQYSPLEREQLLMQCVELSDKDMKKVSIPAIEERKIKTYVLNIPSSFCDAKGDEILKNTFTITASAKNMVINPMQEIKESEVYLMFRNLRKEPVTAQKAWELNNKKESTYNKHNFFSNYLSYTPYENFSIYINTKQKNIKKRLINAAGEAQGIRGNEDYMVNLGYFDSFNEQITLNFNDIGDYSFDSVELLAVPISSYREHASKLSQNRFTVTNKTGNNHIWGEINSERGGMLYLSILYNPGWKIYIDGVKADDIYHVDTAFMGVEIPVGKHEIELVYKPLGYPYTLIPFGVCVIVTILLESYFRRRK